MLGCGLEGRLLAVLVTPRRFWDGTEWDCARSGALLPLAALVLDLLSSEGSAALPAEPREEGWLVLRSLGPRRPVLDWLVELAAKGVVSRGELAVRARSPDLHPSGDRLGSRPCPRRRRSCV